MDPQHPMKYEPTHTQRLPQLKFIVTKFDATPEQRIAVLKYESLQIYNFKELEAIGAASPHNMKPPNKDDVAVLMYTSGTTGMPKGALLTHDNIIFTGHMWLYQIHKGPHVAGSGHGSVLVNHDDCLLTVLPKAHLMALCTELQMTQGGGRIALFRGDIKKLLEDLQRVQPTAFPIVPVLLNRIYNRVMEAVEASWVKKKIFEYAIAHKLSWYSQGYVSNNTWYDYFLFSKVQKLLGGRMKVDSKIRQMMNVKSLT
jgi:long-chain acyl-CoA synthetase